MQGTTDHNANGVTQQVRQRKISASRKFHESRKIEPTDMARPIGRNVNGNAKHGMFNGQAKKASTASLDPNNFFEAATLLGSVGSLKAAETTERVRRGSTSHEEDVYKDFGFSFENLVFEGGGNKGMAYVGALQVCILMFCFVVFFCYDKSRSHRYFPSLPRVYLTALAKLSLIFLLVNQITCLKSQRQFLFRYNSHFALLNKIRSVLTAYFDNQNSLVNLRTNCNVQSQCPKSFFSVLKEVT